MENGALPSVIRNVLPVLNPNYPDHLRVLARDSDSQIPPALHVSTGWKEPQNRSAKLGQVA